MLLSSSIYRNDKLRSIFQIECVHRETLIFVLGVIHIRGPRRVLLKPVNPLYEAESELHQCITSRAHSKFTFPVPNMAAGFPKPTVKRKRFAARFTFSQSLNSRCNLWRITAAAGAWIMYLHSQRCCRCRCCHRKSRSKPKGSQIKVKDKSGLRENNLIPLYIYHYWAKRKVFLVLLGFFGTG